MGRLPGHEFPIKPKKAVEFLEEAAKYFEKRKTNGEDQAYWSNLYNAGNCRRIADLIRLRLGWDKDYEE